jgi:hypothetical protein
VFCYSFLVVNSSEILLLFPGSPAVVKSMGASAGSATLRGVPRAAAAAARGGCGNRDVPIMFLVKTSS